MRKMRDPLKNCESNIVMHLSIRAIPNPESGWQAQTEPLAPVKVCLYPCRHF